MKKIFLKVASIGGVLMALPTKAYAQFNIKRIHPLYPVEGDLFDLVDTIANIIFMVLGILAVVYLIWGGATYITAGGDAEKAAKGRTAITNAIIGIVIILISFALYRFILGSLGGGIV